jgi:uncharacterized protein
MLRAAARTALHVSELATTPFGLLDDEITEQGHALEELSHRPWPVPDRPWLMGQTWRDLLFAHWRVDRETLGGLIPSPLELHLHEGDAWLGITPFVLTGLRAHGTPPLPWLSRFPELNVRTYVTFGGRPGIYFFSLDAGRRLAVAAARHGYRLPYFHAEMRAERAGEEIRYRSARIDRGGPAAELRLSYRPTAALLGLRDGSLERWLAERYCVYVVDEGKTVLRGDIHHRPWPLRLADAEIESNTMARTLGIELAGPPLLHYSARQDTLIWNLAPVDGRGSGA